MIQNNYMTDNEDIMLHFKKLIDWEEVVKQYEDEFQDSKKYNEGDERFAMAPHDTKSAVDYYQEVLTVIGELSGKEVAPIANELDKTGLKFQDGKVIFPEKMMGAWEKFKASGLLPFLLKRESGGLGLPTVVSTLIIEITSRADISFSMAINMLNLAETVEKFASPELKAKWLPKMASGEYTGAMALTEPNFGSDLSSVMTRATKQPDGTYRINGTKRFITHGCGMGNAPAVILTLARTGEGAGGARGLSFFAVDGKYVQVLNIEHKLGIKCSPTCEIIYENSPAEIIGEEGYGLTRYAMGMMNGARLATGTIGLSVGTASYFEALKYASEREQFGRLIKDIPAVKKMLDRMEREVAAMRCLNLEAARMIDLYHWKKNRLEQKGENERAIRNDEQIKYWDKLAGLFTPISKYYCSEMGNSLAYDAIQVHGGVGFTEEFDVAKIYRDARILTIYEGTTQLQTVAAIGGVVTGMSAKGQLRDYLENSMKTFSVSKETKKIFEMLEQSVEFYKSLGDGNDKDYNAFEVVQNAARMIVGFLFEKSNSKLSGEVLVKRKKLSDAYNVESLSICKANLMKLESAVKKEAVLG